MFASVLVVTNKDVARSAPVSDAITLVEEAFHDFGQHRLLGRVRL